MKIFFHIGLKFIIIRKLKCQFETKDMRLYLHNSQCHGSGNMRCIIQIRTQYTTMVRNYIGEKKEGMIASMPSCIIEQKKIANALWMLNERVEMHMNMLRDWVKYVTKNEGVILDFEWEFWSNNKIPENNLISIVFKRPPITFLCSKSYALNFVVKNSRSHSFLLYDFYIAFLQWSWKCEKNIIHIQP